MGVARIGLLCFLILPSISSASVLMASAPETTEWQWEQDAEPVGAFPVDTSLLIPQPQLLAEWWIDKNPTFLSGSATITTKLDRLRISFGPTAGFSTGPALFDDAVVTVEEIGHVFVADAGNDPDFQTVVSQLTNGSTTDTVFVVTGIVGFGAAGAKQTESFWATNPSAPGDFAGYQITRIEMYIKDAFFTSPGRDPNGNGNWTDYRIDRKLRIYGTAVPEPNAVVGVGILIPIVMSRRAARLVKIAVPQS